MNITEKIMEDKRRVRRWYIENGLVEEDEAKPMGNEIRAMETEAIPRDMDRQETEEMRKKTISCSSVAEHEKKVDDTDRIDASEAASSAT